MLALRRVMLPLAAVAIVWSAADTSAQYRLKMGKCDICWTCCVPGGGFSDPGAGAPQRQEPPKKPEKSAYARQRGAQLEADGRALRGAIESLPSGSEVAGTAQGQAADPTRGRYAKHFGHASAAR